MKKTLQNWLVLCLIAGFLWSCSESSVNNNDEDLAGSVLIFNQGGFNRGDASISAFNTQTGVVQHNLFLNRNSRPLGDVFQSWTKHNGLLYLVINNIRKIEVIEPGSLTSLRTLNFPGHISPRYLAILPDDSGFVTSLFTDYVYKFNISNGALIDSIHVGAGQEGILFADNKLFVAKNLNSDWSAASGVVIIDPTTLNIERTIATLPGASMMISTPAEVIVNATGEWGMDNGGVTRISRSNPNHSSTIELNATTSGLTYSAFHNSIFVLSNGIVKIDLTNENQTRLSNRSFYGIGVYDLEEGTIYAAYAGNYSDPGFVYRYNINGNLLDSIGVGVAPVSFYFE